MNIDLKKLQETAENLRIIDDTLFRLVAEKKDVCQEILRTLLDMPTLKVINVNAQSLVKSLHREVTLDALCKLDDGSFCNIEMQKGKNNDDVARARFHASALTAQYTLKGTEFSDIPDVTILYITEYDALKNGRTVTHVSRCMEMGKEYLPVNDGEDIIFANTSIDDGSEKSELLQLMLRKDPFYNKKFPAVSKAVRYFKDTKGGRKKVCEAVKAFADSCIIESEQKRAETEQKLVETEQKLVETEQKLTEARELIARLSERK
jgi:predicted transposase/invertase (TIGR01784 family)